MKVVDDPEVVKARAAIAGGQSIEAKPRMVHFSSIEQLARRLGTEASFLLDLIDIPERTRARRKLEGFLKPDEADRLLRIARVFGEAVRVFGSEGKAARWMKASSRAVPRVPTRKMRRRSSYLGSDAGAARGERRDRPHRLRRFCVMRVWRITRQVHIVGPLSGEGAARSGSRWNSKGVRIAYTSTSRPLAVLEMLVHVTRDSVPDDIVLVPVDVPPGLIEEMEHPPRHWNDVPESDPARHAGDRWVHEQNSVALLVPSVVMPAEKNLLLNPLHPEFAKVKIHPPETHPIDRRLLP